MGDDDTSLRVALFQPVLAHYRVGLFNAMHDAVGGGLTLFATASRSHAGVDDAPEGSVVPRRPSPTRRWGPLWFVPRTLPELWSRRWDVVVLSWNVRQIELLPALLIARWRGVPVILWGHGLGSHGSGPVVVLRRWQARLASAVLTYSDQGRRDVQALAPDQRLRVMLNTSARPAPGDDGHLQEVRHRLAYLGRLDGRKCVGRLVAALPDISRPDVTLDIVGDGPERERIEAQIHDLGLGDRVRCHGQIAGWEALSEILRRCDLVVQPAAAGLAVVDAFAAARGAVVLDEVDDNGPEAELVVDGRTGYRYWPPTPRGLADCLTRAFDRTDEVLEISRCSAACYRERLGQEAAAAAFAGVVGEVVAPGTRLTARPVGGD